MKMKMTSRGLAITFGTLSLADGALTAPTETVLYSFKGGCDGGIPYAGLLADEQGVLYGATDIGGSTSVCEGNTGGCGTVFKLTPRAGGQTQGTETVLYSLKGGSDGAFPSDLIVNDRGALFGTTAIGGE